MQIKWLEDLLALAGTHSFKHAAERRHVTQPAFGRRIRSLEAWAGVPLVVRGSQPVRLTPAGAQLAQHARAATQEIEQLRIDLRATGTEPVVRLVTGRALARGLVADALTRLWRQPAPPQVRVLTRVMSDASDLLERDEVDLLLGYQHPSLVSRLDGRRYLSARVAEDHLVPVVRADAGGRAGLMPGKAPLLTYDPGQSLGALVDDYLAHLDGAPRLQTLLRCDSVDSLHEYTLRGLGVAWLPWSMISADVRAGRLAAWDEPTWKIQFEIRIHRRKRPAAESVLALWDALVDADPN